MSPIVATDGQGRKCVIVAFVSGPVGNVEAVCAYGPIPGGRFYVVQLSELTFDLTPMGWPLYGYWQPDPVPA